MDKREPPVVDARPIQTSVVDARPLQTSVIDARPIQPSVVYAVPVYPVQNDAFNGQSGNLATGGNLNNLPQATLVGVVQTVGFGSEPARVICQFCGADVVTAVKVTPSVTSHLWALGLCVFGCWPCCFVPYFVNDCLTHIHICPNCGHEIGVDKLL